MNPISTLEALIAALEAGNYGAALTDIATLVTYISTTFFPVAPAVKAAPHFTSVADCTAHLKNLAAATTIDWTSIFTTLMQLLQLLTPLFGS